MSPEHHANALPPIKLDDKNRILLERLSHKKSYIFEQFDHIFRVGQVNPSGFRELLLENDSNSWFHNQQLFGRILDRVFLEVALNFSQLNLDSGNYLFSPASTLAIIRSWQKEIQDSPRILPDGILIVKSHGQTIVSGFHQYEMSPNPARWNIRQRKLDQAERLRALAESIQTGNGKDQFVEILRGFIPVEFPKDVVIAGLDKFIINYVLPKNKTLPKEMMLDNIKITHTSTDSSDIFILSKWFLADYLGLEMDENGRFKKVRPRHIPVRR